MSTTVAATAAAPKAPGASSGSIGVTFGRVVRSEWIKLRTLRSTWITLAVALVLMVGVGVLVCWSVEARWSHLSPAARLRFDPLFRSLVGINLAQLAIGVLGVLVVTGEYGTGMIRSTLAAIPRRIPVVPAKLLVFGAASLVVGMVAAFVSFFSGQAVLASHATTIGAPHVLRAVFGAGIYLTLTGLLAVGIGFAIRNTAGGIATLFGLLLVLPGVAQALPSSWQPYVVPYFPSNAGAALYTIRPSPNMLDPWSGFGVFVGWVVAAAVAGLLVLRHRDA